MKPITLYLDMDGVECNFEKAFRQFNPTYVWDRKLFRQAILEGKIFETLEWMPNGEQFIHEIREIEKDYRINIEMLTSTGSSDPEIKAAASAQKTKWLLDHGITWKPNFVCAKHEKAAYAHQHTILVDDHSGCTTPFIDHGGVAFLHHDSDYKATIQKLRWFLDEYYNEQV